MFDPKRAISTIIYLVSAFILLHVPEVPPLLV